MFKVLRNELLPQCRGIKQEIRACTRLLSLPPTKSLAIHSEESNSTRYSQESPPATATPSEGRREHGGSVLPLQHPSSNHQGCFSHTALPPRRQYQAKAPAKNPAMQFRRFALVRDHEVAIHPCEAADIQSAINGPSARRSPPLSSASETSAATNVVPSPESPPDQHRKTPREDRSWGRGSQDPSGRQVAFRGEGPLQIWRYRGLFGYLRN